MSPWRESDMCRLCERTDNDVKLRLVRWRDALPGMQYEHVPRCEDRAACQSRVQAAGRVWPLEVEVQA